MASSLPFPTARRLLPGLVALLSLGVTMPGAAYADSARHAGSSSATASPATTVPTTTRAPKAGLSTTKLDRRFARAERDLLAARTAYQEALDARAVLSEHAAALRAQADLAGQRAAALRHLAAEEPMGGLLDDISSFVTGDTSTVDRAVDAVENEQHAVSLVRLAQGAVLDANGTVIRRQHRLAEARDTAAAVEADASARVAARSAVAQSRFGADYQVADAAQDRLNHEALRSWHTYLTSLGRAGIVPPRARALEDPQRLDEPFTPVRDERGHAIPGAASVRRDGARDLTVLSRETIRAVSESFSLVGLEQYTGNDYTCGGLVARAWDATSYPIAGTADAQWLDLEPVPAAQRQPGDLVFAAGVDTRPDRAGLLVAEGLMIGTDPTTGVAQIQRVGGSDVLVGTRRVTVPSDGRVTRAGDNLISCEVPVPVTPTAVAVAGGTAMPAAGGWSWPVELGSYTPSTAFGTAGPLWSSGHHTGQDFAAPIGTPVHAARGGVVTVEHPAWAGNLVRVDHGDGLETLYAHLSEVDVTTGQQVAAGTLVGRVGDEGNSTGPHLHFEVRVGGVAVDPMPMLTGQPDR